MRTTRTLIATLLALSLALCAACGDDGGETTPDDATPIDAPPATPDADCIADPQTSQEILNACTDAERIKKTPNLPLLLPDGGLPPLPE